MGTAADYLALNRDILAGDVYRLPELVKKQDGLVYTGENVHIDSSAVIEGWCVLGDNVTVESGASLRNAVVWDNVVVSENSSYSNRNNFV